MYIGLKTGRKMHTNWSEQFEDDDEIIEVSVSPGTVNKSSNMPVFYNGGIVIGHIVKNAELSGIDFIVASGVPDRLLFNDREHTRVALQQDVISSQRFLLVRDSEIFEKIDALIYRNFIDLNKKLEKWSVNQEVLKDFISHLSLNCIHAIYPEITGFAAFVFARELSGVEPLEDSGYVSVAV